LLLRVLRALIITLLALMPWPVTLAVSRSLVISELQTGTSTAASQEFIELYNPSAADVVLDGWSIQYKSASSVDAPSSWARRASLAGTIKAHGFYLIAPKVYLGGADAELSTGLAVAGGHVRLIDSSGTVIDLLAWGTANTPEGATAPAPVPDESLERRVGALKEDGGNAIDSDNNYDDFDLRDAPQPQNTASPAEQPATLEGIEEPDQSNPPLPAPTQPTNFSTDASSSATPPANTATGNTFGVSITELLVDPEPPYTDANDEFIELYNGTNQPISLTGYKLQTGKNFRDSYTLPELTVQPQSYEVIYSRDSRLALTNSGGAARLLYPDGSVAGQTADYTDADAGVAWADMGGVWEWTSEPTPGRANVLLAAPTRSARSKKSSSSAKGSAVKAAKSSKGSAGKSTRVGSVKTLAAQSQAGADDEGAAAQPPSKWLLIGAVALTIGYALYEFRHDFQNCYYIIRRKFGTGRKNRPAT
jgi:hypothetical protein